MEQEDSYSSFFPRRPKHFLPQFSLNLFDYMVHFLENVKLPNNIISFMCTAAQQLNFLEMSHAWVMPKGTNWEYTEGRDNLPILLIWKVSEFCWKGSGTLFAITKSLDTWNWGLTLSVLHSSSGKLLHMLIIWIFCRLFGVEAVPDPYCISQDKLIFMITVPQLKPSWHRGSRYHPYAMLQYG